MILSSNKTINNLRAFSKQTTTLKVLTMTRQQGIVSIRASKTKNKNLQSHPEEYTFAHHQIIHHQVHNIVLVLKENQYLKKNMTRNYLQVLEMILLILHCSLTTI